MNSELKNDLDMILDENVVMKCALEKAQVRVKQLEEVNRHLNEERYGLRWGITDGQGTQMGTALVEIPLYYVDHVSSTPESPSFMVLYQTNDRLETIGHRATLGDAQELARAHFESLDRTE